MIKAIRFEDVNGWPDWDKINAITGAGCPPVPGRSIDLTGLDPAKIAEVEKLMKKKTTPKAEESK